MQKTASSPILFRDSQGLHKGQETLAREVTLCLTIEGKEDRSLITCSPGQESHLVMGRLRAAQLICDTSQIQDMTITQTDEDNLSVHVVLHQSVPCKAQKKRDISRLQGTVVFECVRDLETRQVLFPQTGCTHGAALFNQQGELLTMAEDVARHSALEKAIGQALEEQTLARAVLAVMTSRLNVDLVACAAAVGLTFLCGISAGTFAALQAAKRHDLTLIGRVRGQGMNIYTGHERLIWDEDNLQTDT